MSSIAEITEDELVLHISNSDGTDIEMEFQSESLSSTMLVSLYENHKTDLKTALFMTRYSNTPSRVLVQISKDWHDESVLVALASHQRTQPEILQNLALSHFLTVRKSVACNKSLTPQTVAILVLDNNCIVRSMVAENITQFPTSQLQLASDTNACVATSLIAHKKCADQARKLIFEHENMFVKMSLAAVVNTSDDRLLELADSNDENAQNALFLRSGLPDEVLESLCFSEHKDIAINALKKKHLDDDELLGWAKNGDSAYRALIAARTNLPDLIQEVLAEDTSTNVLTALVANRSLCERAANMVVECCADEEVIIALASNPGTSQDVITKLCHIDDQTAHQVLSLRSDLSDEHLDILINEKRELDLVYTLAMRNIEFVGLSREVTRILVMSELPTIRAFASKSEALDLRDIPRLVFDPYQPVIENLIDNKNTNESTLEHLSKNDNEIIAQRAVEELQRRKGLECENEHEEPGFIAKVLQAIKV